jgi:hypothetical protein
LESVTEESEHMSALVMLTPEEIETIRTGSLEDPTYRPFPSGRRARMEQEEEIRAEEEGREQESMALDEPSIIERMLAAQYWSRYSLELAILLAPVTPGNPEFEIVGLARAQGGPRSKTFGTRRVTLGPWELLVPPVLLDDVSSRLTSRQQRKLQEILNGRTRPLPPELNAAFTRVLAQISPGIMEQARRLTRPEPRSRRVRDLLEQRDANATALSILTPYWRDLRPEEISVPPPTALSMDQILAESATENDLITSDAAVFPEWERGGRPVAG